MIYGGFKSYVEIIKETMSNIFVDNLLKKSLLVV
jgi:hypothetical protein